MNETPSPVIREATVEDCRSIALFLRQADRETIRTATGLSHEEGVVATFQASEQRFAVVFDGKPIALFGAADLGDDTGSPWLLATGRLKPFMPWLLQAMPQFVSNLQRVYGTLTVLADTRDTMLLVVLRRCGFCSGRVVLMGSDGVPFRLYWKQR